MTATQLDAHINALVSFRPSCLDAGLEVLHGFTLSLSLSAEFATQFVYKVAARSQQFENDPSVRPALYITVVSYHGEGKHNIFTRERADRVALAWMKEQSAYNSETEACYMPLAAPEIVAVFASPRDNSRNYFYSLPLDGYNDYCVATS